MQQEAPIQIFPTPPIEEWITQYKEDVLRAKDKDTIEAYCRVLRTFLTWLSEKPGNHQQFHPQSLTSVAVQTFVNTLKSYSHKKQARAAISGFVHWIIEEKRLLDRNPMSSIHIPPQALLAPRELSDDQRYVLKDLVEREGDLRGKAAFALGYWAGCRVSDVSWLLREQAHLSSKAGSVKVGHKGGKERTIDLANEARRPLYEYLQASTPQEPGATPKSAYVFISQRAKKRLSADECDGWRWTEDGVQQWWQQIKQKARVAEAQLIHDVEFHDLRHDFAHRVRDAGWSIEEIAYYLGHITNAGTPAIQTTIRYLQVSREKIKQKVKDIKG